jgi:hypothetical protein
MAGKGALPFIYRPSFTLLPIALLRISVINPFPGTAIIPNVATLHSPDGSSSSTPGSSHQPALQGIG